MSERRSSTIYAVVERLDQNYGDDLVFTTFFSSRAGRTARQIIALRDPKRIFPFGGLGGKSPQFSHYEQNAKKL